VVVIFRKNAVLTLHLRFCRLSAAANHPRLDDWRALLTSDERAHCARLPKTQEPAVTLTRALLRSEMSALLSVPPQALALQRGPHGKPWIDAPRRRPAFNLSHSGDWLVLAWHEDADVGALGVDLEHRQGRTRDVLRLARRYFSPEETRVLENLEGESREGLFYRLWTLKEAWVKAHGLALAPLLRAMTFRFEATGIDAANHSEHATGRFLHLEPDAGVLLSACVLGAGERAFHIEARRGLPLEGWSTFALQRGCESTPLRR
jgi:4'-phosphopantetheinyl transferase